MNFEKAADQIIQLKNEDLNFRQQLVENGELANGYHEDMEKLHVRNAQKLNEIIAAIGYPSNDKVGEEASDAAWIIIQHSISQPDFMKKCRDLLKIEVDEGKSSPVPLAYLSDRIAVFEGQMQLYGTQFDWDDSGALSPNKYDDLDKVNERRKSIGLNTLQEQQKIIRRRALTENEKPPRDLVKRNLEMEQWKIQVGWEK